MPVVKVCNRVQGKSTVHKIEINDVGCLVTELKEAIAKEIESSCNEIELIFAGNRLLDGKSISEFGVKPGVTVHALRKRESTCAPAPDKLDTPAVRQLAYKLKKSLLSPAYPTIIERIFANDEVYETLISTTPGIQSDPVSISLLKSPELLSVACEPKQFTKVLAEHPALAPLITSLASMVQEETTKKGYKATRTPTAGMFSLDQMSDDDDDDDDVMMPNNAGGGVISANQLAAALAAASGSPASSSQPAASQGSGGGGNISADFFQQAMARALSGATEDGTNNATSAREAAPVVSQEQLTQLREMGITDEAVARQALIASGGDIQAALEFIFGDNS